MPIIVQPIDVDNDNFLDWIEKTNAIANVISTAAVTVNSNTALGDAYISGSLGSNALY